MRLIIFFDRALSSVPAADITAWALGSLGGYTFTALPWTPGLGSQVDTSSGDGDPGDDIFGTFNPLFPRGSYFSLSGLTGYANLIHAKRSITTSPTRNLKITLAAAAHWRQTTSAAIYTAPDIGTVGRARCPPMQQFRWRHCASQSVLLSSRLAARTATTWGSR